MRKIGYRLPKYSDSIEFVAGSGKLTRKLGEADSPAKYYLVELETYINAAILQVDRIRSQWNTNYPHVLEALFEPSKNNTGHLAIGLDLLLVETHYYFIAMDKVEKNFFKFWRTTNHLGQVGSQQQKEAKRKAGALFKSAIRSIKDARDYFEHFEKEIASKGTPILGFKVKDGGATLLLSDDKNEETELRIDVQPVIVAYANLVEWLSTLQDI
jgi:hypothetical protein